MTEESQLTIYWKQIFDVVDEFSDISRKNLIEYPKNQEEYDRQLVELLAKAEDLRDRAAAVAETTADEKALSAIDTNIDNMRRLYVTFQARKTEPAETEENPRALNPGYRVPTTTVRLGTVLDLDVQRHQYRYDIDEFKNWHMLANENGTDQQPGYARLWLIPGKLEKTNAETSEAANATYKDWHRSEPDKIGELNTPDYIGYYQGRVLRIGYRSDKWNRDPVDYDHSFIEEGTPPKIYTDKPKIEDSTAAILAGGSFVITSRGIE